VNMQWPALGLHVRLWFDESRLPDGDYSFSSVTAHRDIRPHNMVRRFTSMRIPRAARAAPFTTTENVTLGPTGSSLSLAAATDPDNIGVPDTLWSLRQIL